MESDSDCAIVLAAGQGSRMGLPKGLMRIDGTTPWLIDQLGSLRACGLRRAVVVVGHAADAYRVEIGSFVSALAGANEASEFRVHVVENRAPDVGGTFGSVRLGLAECGALFRDVGAWIVPVDVPCPGAEVFALVARAAKGAGVDAAVPTFAGRGGHPVWLGASLCRMIESIDVGSNEARLDAILRARPTGAVARVAVDDARVTMNLNTPDDVARYARFVAEYESQSTSVDNGSESLHE